LREGSWLVANPPREWSLSVEGSSEPPSFDQVNEYLASEQAEKVGQN
jgi:hypothetical protein